MLRHYIILIVLCFGLSLRQGLTAQTQNPSKYEATLSGQVLNNWTGEPLYGVNVFVKSLSQGTTTDVNGNYEIVLPKGTFRVTYSRIDLMEISEFVDLIEDVSLNIEMKEKVTNLDEVTIYDEAENANITNLNVGKNVIEIDRIRKIPAFMGEPDVIKSLILLPGVSTVGEGSSGFNVRGGGVDQNLVLQDGAMIFNPSHVFGFFSIFNPALVSKGALYKSGLSAQYGGRLSSVLDVSLKDGSYKDYSYNLNLGLIATNIAVDGPIIEDKLSFVFGARGSYGDWMLGLIKDPNLKNSTASFQDFNFKLSYLINSNNQLNYSGYYSHDQFGFSSTALYDWYTFNNVLNWNHSINDKMYFDVNLVNSSYQYGIEDEDQGNEFGVTSQINYTSLKSALFYDISEKNKIIAGFEGILYDFNPGLQEPIGESSNVERLELETERSIETSVYIEDEYKVNSKLSVRGGLRFTSFTNVGAGTDYLYGPNDSRNSSNIIDTVSYSQGEVIAQYQGFEPRVVLNYSLGDRNSIKASYNRTRQFLHFVSNTSSAVPSDTWKTSNRHIEPEVADQYSIGFFRNLRNNTIEASVETYYKKSTNIVDFKDGTSLLMNENIEADLVNGTARAYGVEFFLNKKKGQLTGWMSYTYARSFRRVNGEYEDEIVNDGQKYPSNYDKPHDFTTALAYQSTPVLEWGMNFTYSTGRPTTEPRALYDLSGNQNLFSYSSRNGGRIFDYHRMDVSVTFHSKPKIDRSWKMSWTFSIYNLYGKKNAYSVFYENRSGSPPSAYKLSILGAPYPSLSVNFKIK